MPIIGRKTLKSQRARMRRIDKVFEYIGKGVIIAYALFIFVAWLSGRESFFINSVDVPGLHFVNEESIHRIVDDELQRTLLWKIKRNNVVFFPYKNTEARLWNLDSRIKSIHISAEFPSRISVHLDEYLPNMIWCDDTVITMTSECYYGDEDGYVFAPAPAFSGYLLPVYTGTSTATSSLPVKIGSSVFANGEFALIRRFTDFLRKDGFTIVQVSHIGERDYEIRVGKPWVILWSTTKDPQEGANNLRVILQSLNEDNQINMNDLHVIDLRFGPKIFYR